jgi:hypothetical protein
MLKIKRKFWMPKPLALMCLDRGGWIKYETIQLDFRLQVYGRYPGSSPTEEEVM